MTTSFRTRDRETEREREREREREFLRNPIFNKLRRNISFRTLYDPYASFNHTKTLVTRTSIAQENQHLEMFFFFFFFFFLFVCLFVFRGNSN